MSNGDDESDDADAGPAIKPFFTKLWKSNETSIGGDGTVELAAGVVESV